MGTQSYRWSAPSQSVGARTVAGPPVSGKPTGCVGKFVPAERNLRACSRARKRVAELLPILPMLALVWSGCKEDETAGLEVAHRAGTTAILDMAADDRSVYWLSAGESLWDGRVSRWDVGEEGTTLVANAQFGPTSIAVDDANVYWWNATDPESSDSLLAVAKTGPSGEPSELANSRSIPYLVDTTAGKLVAVGAELLSVGARVSDGSAACGIVAIPTAGGEASWLELGGGTGAMELAASGGTVAATCGGSIFVVDLDERSTAQVDTSEGSLVLGVSSRWIAWASSLGETSALSILAVGSTAKTSVALAGTPIRLQVWEDDVWIITRATSGEGHLHKVAAANGTIAASFPVFCPTALAVPAGNVVVVSTPSSCGAEGESTLLTLR